MKYIVAIILPEKVDEVITALNEVDVWRLSLSDCRSIGAMNQTAEVYRGMKYTVQYRLKTRMEIAVNDEFLQPTIDTICRVCSTGELSDGGIFVTDLLHCVNIGTGKLDREGI